MIFRHPALLLALFALAVPIVVHLLNKRSAKIVQWGAMHFLMGSLVSRKRHVMLEDVMLLALRCLLVALIVLAFARPVMTAGSSLAWALLLPMVLAAALALGSATALWQYRRARFWLLGSGFGLLLAMAAIVLEERLQLNSRVAVARDVALVFDASDSMSLKVGGQSNFDRAVDEARQLVETLGSGSTVSIVLAGPLPEIKTPFPLTDVDRIKAALNDVKLLGGNAAMADALEAAAAILARGSHATRSIVIFTDGQSAGWKLDDLGRWQLTATSLRSTAQTDPELVCRTYDIPKDFRNLAVTELTAARKVVGTDRPLPIRASIANTGSAPVSACSAYLYVDGKQTDRRPVTELQPGGSLTVSFNHRFETAGYHGVEVRTDVEDDLPADNRRTHAVHVGGRLGVLAIDGRADARRFDRAATFVQLALDPRSLARPPATQPPEASEKPVAGGKTSFIEVTVVDGLQSGAIKDLDQHQVVILADMPQLQAQTAARLAAFVAEGGGLLIAPGARARPAFYNAWRGPDGNPLLGATLKETVTKADEPEPLAVKTTTHPALSLMIESGKHDLANARFQQYWQLQPDEADKQVFVGARLEEGGPLLVERPVGKGRVLLTAASLDLRSGNLPTCRSFLPLIHALVYHLADAAQAELNHPASRELDLDLGEIADVAGAPVATREGEQALEAKAPDGSAVKARGQVAGGQLSLKVERAGTPGLYKLKLDPLAAGSGGNALPELTFAVLPDPGESNLEALSDSEWSTLDSILGLQHHTGFETMVATLTSGGYGRELWQYLAVAALIVVLCEVVAGRWIAMQRRSSTTTEVMDFGVAAASSSPAEKWARLQAEANAGRDLQRANR